MKERTSNKLTIYTSDGTALVEAVIESSSVRKFTLMSEDYIRLDFKSEDAVNIPIGSYIEDPIFGKFVVTDEQMPKYEESTASYKYELQLNAEYMALKNKLFMLTYVNSTTGERTRREATWSLTAKLADHLDELINNIAVIAGDAHGYTYDVTGCETATEAHTMTYSGTNIIEALGNLADEWECEWWVEEKVIHFGKCESSEDAIELSLTNGTVAQMQIQDDRETYANKVYVFGSTNNMPFSYRKKLYLTVTGTKYVTGTEYYTVDKAITSDMVALTETFSIDGPKTAGTIPPTSYNGYVMAYGSWAITPIGTYDLKNSSTIAIYGFKEIPYSLTKSGATPTLTLSVRLLIEDDQYKGTEIASASKECVAVDNGDGTGYFKLPDGLSAIFLSASGSKYTFKGKHRLYIHTSWVKTDCNLTSTETSYMASCTIDASVNTDSKFAYVCTKTDGTKVVIYFSNAEKGTDLYQTISTDATTDLETGDILVVPTNSYLVPSAYFADATDDPSSLLTLGENRLRMPESTGDYLIKSGVKDTDAVEKVVIFDGIYPDGKLYAKTVTAVEKKDYTEYDGETVKSDWQWHEYTLDPYLVTSKEKFSFDKKFMLPNTDLQIRFLTPEDVGETDPGDGYKLAGMTFGVQFNTSDKTFTIVRNSDFGALLPNDILKPTEGDPFVLIGWNVYAMEDLGLVDDAEQRLLAKAQEYMDALEDGQFTFTCTMRSDWMFNLIPYLQVMTADGEALLTIDDYPFMVFNDFNAYAIPGAGTKVKIVHSALSASKTSRVIGFEFKLDKPYDSPVYTIGETEAYSRLAKIEKEISNN